MKKILFFLLFSITLKAHVVIGSLQYPKGKQDYLATDVIGITLDNKTTVNIAIDQISDNTIFDLVRKHGVKKKDILFARGFGSSISDEIEIWFAYKGSSAYDYEIKLNTPHHFYSDYAYKNAIMIPWWQHIGYKSDSLAKVLMTYGPYRSFKCTPYPVPELAFQALAYGLRSGGLADMRNVPNSYLLVPFFKSLNWKIIWYQDANGTQKAEYRPGDSWPQSAAPVKISNFQTEMAIRDLMQRMTALEENEGSCCCDPIHHVALFWADFFGTSYESDPITLNINDRLPLDNICPGATGVVLMNDATIYCTYVGLPDQWIVTMPVHGGITN